MKAISKKEGLYIATFSIGVLALTSTLLHDYMQQRATQYGPLDKAGIIIGGLSTLVGSMLFIFSRYGIYEKTGILSAKVFFLEALLVVILVASLCGVGGWLYSNRNFEGPEGWSIGIYTSSSYAPFDFTGVNVNNPVLTANDITHAEIEYVADPFLTYENSTYFMFFEVLNANTDQGDIALATSNDGLSWTYEQIVLDEPFHLSYPYVFKWKSEYYMIPESGQDQSIRLYKADNFPYDWSFIKILLEGEAFVDNTIFHYDDMWWLFTGTVNNDVLRLHYSDTPLGPWTEHPKSPIIEGDANIARPGGNVIVFDGRILRYTQDCDPYYGNQVWAFEITTLTTRDYEEHRVGTTPILKGFDNWNTRGMHQISPYRVSENRWIASVDGF
ncbi:MAG: hypothetical protein OEZ07_02405 [Dehalococcoidia bacterium]|nr:hypothetical protein [Dehalococcoidia bacterium]